MDNGRDNAFNGKSFRNDVEHVESALGVTMLNFACGIRYVMFCCRSLGTFTVRLFLSLGALGQLSLCFANTLSALEHSLSLGLTARKV